MTRTLVLTALALALAATEVLPQPQADKRKSEAVAEDVMDHRTMAEAHRKAAECLEAGKPEKDCRAQLGKDCKGVGIGKICGMRDRHKH